MNRRTLLLSLLAPVVVALPKLKPPVRYWVEFRADVGKDKPLRHHRLGAHMRFPAESYEQAVAFLDYEMHDGWKPQHIKVASITIDDAYYERIKGKHTKAVMLSNSWMPYQHSASIATRLRS